MDNGYERLGGVALFMRETIDSDTLVIETQAELNRIAAQDASEKTFRKLIIEVDAAEVPYGAFDGCKSLEKVIFEKDVAFIGGSAFARCFQLKTVTFEGRGPERMHDTFMFCRSLKYIRLPEGLRELDSGVFYECTALSYVRLPSSLEWIVTGSFIGCDSLLSLTIPDGVNIGHGFNPSLDGLSASLTGDTAIKQLVLMGSLGSIIDTAFMAHDLQHGSALETVFTVAEPSQTLLDAIAAAEAAGAAPIEVISLASVENAEDREIITSCTEQGAIIENGWLVEKRDGECIALMPIEAQTVIKVPDWIDAFHGVPYGPSFADKVERIELGDNVRSIGQYGFFSYQNLKTLLLPSTLRDLGSDMITNRDIKTLLIPRNTQMHPVTSTETYGTLYGLCPDTLVFCGTEAMFFWPEFSSLEFPLDGSGRIVFWGAPPEHIEIKDLIYSFRASGDTGWREQGGAFTICYPREFAKDWAPNGETRWHSLPIRELTSEEEAAIKAENPKLFAVENLIDHTVDPGWTFDTAYNVDIFTADGWKDFIESDDINRTMELRFAEGITAVTRVDATHFWTGELDTAVADTLILPSTCRSVDLSNLYVNEIEVAEGNPYLKVVDGKLYSSSNRLLWSPPETPYETPAPYTPLTEDEIEQRFAEYDLYVGDTRFVLDMDVDAFQKAALALGGQEIEVPCPDDLHPEQWAYAYTVGDNILLAIAVDGDVAALALYNAGGRLLDRRGEGVFHAEARRRDGVRLENGFAYFTDLCGFSWMRYEQDSVGHIDIAAPTPAPTATPIVTPQPSPTPEPAVAEETTDIRIPLLIGAIAIVAAAAVIVGRKRK